MNPEKIAILGGGNMGRALVGGLLRQGTPVHRIAVGERSPAARSALAQDYGVLVLAENRDAIAHASLVVIALKPQHVGEALEPLAQTLEANQSVVLSVAAGIRTDAVHVWCGAEVPVVRAMPNRPALVGAGATALFAGRDVKAADRQRAERAMRAVGDVVWVESEDELDVVTALSGSGPAYYFLLTEALMRAAANLGLKSDAARRLAVGTLHGSGLLARESAADMAQLRSEVTSPGGTTEAALNALEAGDFNRLVARAIEAATQRSRELTTQFGSVRARVKGPR